MGNPNSPSRRVASLVPCFNEEKAIGKIAPDFQAALPGAVVYVYDNNSSDRTAQGDAEAGAVVRNLPLTPAGQQVLIPCISQSAVFERGR